MTCKTAPDVSLEGLKSVKQQANTIMYRNAKWHGQHISNANLHGPMYSIYYRH